MHHDAHERDGERWQVRAVPRARAGWIEFIPDGLGQRLPAVKGKPVRWQANGERAGFVLEPASLPEPLAAGWYEVHGCLEVDGAGTALPILQGRHAGDSTLGTVGWVLQHSAGSGRVAALVLFREGVESLGFSPGAGLAPFRMRDFNLGRVSRWRALRVMLGGDGWLACARRARDWWRSVRRHGLKRATDALYADYRERMRPDGVSEYALWARKYDALDHAALDVFRRRARVLADDGPLISLLLWVRDTPESQLRRCLDSVLAQAWERWELCLAGDGWQPASRFTELLAEYAARDPRMRIGGVGQVDGAAEALAMLHGEFLMLLDPDGRLRPHALLRVAETVAADAGLAIVYSDEDEIDADGNRSGHAFKPDWNPDLLRSRNYLGHAVAIRTSLVREAGGLRVGVADDRDHDLILRCSERVAPRQIRHIPEVLYHRCTATGALATRDAAGAVAGGRAVAAHLRRIGSTAVVETIDPAAGLQRVRWPLPQPVPKISLIVPTRDRAAMLRVCVESILAKTTWPDFEIVVVDNQSRERAALRYLERLAACVRVRVLHYDAPFNYSAINNWTARQCDGQLLGLINNDIEVITPDWLEEMAGFAMRPDTGAVGAMLYYPDDTIQHAGIVLGIHGLAGHVYAGAPRGHCGYHFRGRVAQNLSAVTGACLLVRRAVFDAVGGLDETLPVEFNDLDFCLRLQQRGYRNVWTPFAELYHHESASRAIDDTAANALRATGIARMRERWGDWLRDDRAYNPNLTLQGTGCGLAFPPRARTGSQTHGL